MATLTLSHEYDKSAATEDWRVGLVELPPDHVHGATALSAEEWAALSQPKGAEYFLVERTALMGREVSGLLFASRLVACEALRLYARLTPGAFGPFGPLQMVVRKAER